MGASPWRSKAPFGISLDVKVFIRLLHGRQSPITTVHQRVSARPVPVIRKLRSCWMSQAITAGRSTFCDLDVV